MENIKLSEAVDSFLDLYRDKYPEIFNDSKLLAAVKTIVTEASESIGKTTRALTTSLIANSMHKYAKYDIDMFDKNPINEEEKGAFSIAPNEFMKSVLRGLWSIALDVVEGVGYGNADIDRVIESAKKKNGEIGIDDIKFTSTAVGKA